MAMDWQCWQQALMDALHLSRNQHLSSPLEVAAITPIPVLFCDKHVAMLTLLLVGPGPYILCALHAL